MLPHLRTVNHNLANPLFQNPEELVSWMGAIQAQNFSMAKWAVGVRLQNLNLRIIEQALNEGKILRTHILRPTWHFVTADDIRWMLQLTSKRNIAAFKAWNKRTGIKDDLYIKITRLIEKVLEGKTGLTKFEILEGINKTGYITTLPIVESVLYFCESNGIVCSGPEKDSKHTYALIEERVPAKNDLSDEQALALLATKYFQSHSPASLEDFTWWSGLSISEAKKAINLITDDLVNDTYDSQNLYVHANSIQGNLSEPIAQILPPYDEYLISYKDRCAVIDKVHHSKAFNNFGIFQPVILYNGRIVGNWKKCLKKGKATIETSFFDKTIKVDKKIIKSACDRYIQFLKQ